MSKICNICGNENPENLTFCENCGSLLLNAQDSKKDSNRIKKITDLNSGNIMKIKEILQVL